MHCSTLSKLVESNNDNNDNLILYWIENNNELDTKIGKLQTDVSVKNLYKQKALHLWFPLRHLKKKILTNRLFLKLLFQRGV